MKHVSLLFCDDDTDAGPAVVHIGCGSETAADPSLRISVAKSQSVAKVHSGQAPASDVSSFSRASRLSCCALVTLAIGLAPLVSLAAGREFALAPIDLLPNAPTTYQMRDWHKTATDFDTLGV